MPVALWTVWLEPLTNRGSTSIYLYVFFYVMYLYSFSRIVRWLRSSKAHFTLGSQQT